MNQQINFKILVLGSQGRFDSMIGVGKSSLIMRYLKGEFSETYNVTVGVEFASKMVQV
jgi:GTPase SAR1 family protein